MYKNQALSVFGVFVFCFMFIIFILVLIFQCTCKRKVIMDTPVENDQNTGFLQFEKKQDQQT